jgi:branched-chain amino acid transport system permease protein
VRHTVRTGLIFGTVGIFCALTGILLTFHGRWIIGEALSLGQVTLASAVLAAGYQAARQAPQPKSPRVLLAGLGAGAVTGAMLAALIALGSLVPLQGMFLAASPALFELLTFGQGRALGSGILVGFGALLAGLSALVYLGPTLGRRVLVVGLSAVLIVGLFQELIQLMLQGDGLPTRLREFVFAEAGLSWVGAVGIFVVAVGVGLVWTLKGGQVRVRYRGLPAKTRRVLRGTGIATGLALLLLIPLATGAFVGQVLMLVGLYVLMGLGLNLEVGLAGLLDLGFVAFFACGAYTVGLLTSQGPLAIAHLSFWQALPVAVAVAMLVGVLFGVPILGVRGDYLALATLGLGEIVRILVLSDTLAPWLGGSHGVLRIPRPVLGEFSLNDPVRLFYLTLVCAAFVAYCAWRLENSRLGRAWMAIREDEDVAQALGINLVNVKLLAYGLGAAFAGVAGAIFATMLTSVFPQSFQLLVSINVLAVIIVGGMGSLAGVVVGALALIGLPELLREFGEYRFLIYGAALIVMMRFREQGLWPSAIRRREVSVEGAASEPRAHPVEASSGALLVTAEPNNLGDRPGQ